MKIKEVTTREELYLEFPKNGIGAEVGVCRGYNAICLWHITKPKVLHLCDTWNDKWQAPRNLHPSLWPDDNQSIVQQIFAAEISDNRVQTHKLYGGAFLSKLPPNTLDWIYLDADHFYEPVTIELGLALDKVKPGGIIAGHDYCSEPIVWKTGVIRAINEKIQEGMLKMEAITTEHHSSYLCRVIK